MLDFWSWRSTGPLSMLDDGAVADKARRRRAVLTMELSQTRLDGASSLGAGAVEVKARWRRAVLAIVLSESRIDGEQKEGAGDGVR